MYGCQEEGVAKSNSMSGGKGMEATTMSYSALGGTDYDEVWAVDNTTRISGAGKQRAGSNKSEKHWISGDRKDNG